MKVIIDRTKCVGGGNCVMVAPKVFSQDDEDGLVILLDEHPPKDEHENVRQAVTLCPAQVISTEE